MNWSGSLLIGSIDGISQVVYLNYDRIYPKVFSKYWASL